MKSSFERKVSRTEDEAAAGASSPGEVSKPRARSAGLEAVNERLTKRVEGLRADLAGFAKEVAEHPTHAMEWKGRGAMVCDALLRDLSGLVKFLSSERGMKATDAEVANFLKEECEGVVNRLAGETYGGGYSGGEGPWNHNSTNPFANMARLAECDALRMKRAFFVLLVSLLEEPA